MILLQQLALVKFKLKTMKTFFKVITFLIILFPILSCSEDESTDQNLTPITSLSNVSPLNGPKGTEVTINGSNFGTNLNAISVFFNNIRASIQSFSDTEIKAIVPDGALTGFITIIVDGEELTGPEFTYEFTINVSTFAGDRLGFEEGNGTTAKFAAPKGIVADSFGNIYVADRGNFRVRKITPDGDVSTLVGNGSSGIQDGEGASARFVGAEQLTIDTSDNLYLTDESFGSIRKITPTGIVTTLIDGLSSPTGIVVDQSGNIFFADDHKVFKIDLNGTTSVLAGSDPGFADGVGVNAQFETLNQLTIDASGNIYGVDRENHRIRKITPEGVVTTIAGSTAGFADGAGISAQFNNPTGITIDAQNNLYISDSRNHKIRKITPNGNVSTLVGNEAGDVDGNKEIAQFNEPEAIAIDDQGNLFLTDLDNSKIRKISFE